MQCSVFHVECVSEYQVDEPVVAPEIPASLLEEDSTDTETQLANRMITTWSMHTQCTDTDRRTFVMSVTLPAIPKRKKVEPPIPKYYMYSSSVNIYKIWLLRRTFSEVLHDAVQLQNFEKFLLAQDDNGTAPLDFWMAIEEFKTTMTDLRMRDAEAISLQRKYFGQDADKSISERVLGSIYHMCFNVNCRSAVSRSYHL